MGKFLSILFCVMMFHSIAEGSDEPTRLSLSVTVKKSAPPDIAILRISVVTEKNIAEEALQENSKISEQIFANLKPLNIEAKTENIVLTPISTLPQKASDKPFFPEIANYRATHTLSIRIEDLKNLGKVIDTVTRSGGNQIENLQFDIKDLASLKKSAIEEAAVLSFQQADALARASHVTITRVLELTLNGAEIFQSRSPKVAMSLFQDTAVNPSDVEIEVTLNATYEIAPQGLSILQNAS